MTTHVGSYARTRSRTQAPLQFVARCGLAVCSARARGKFTAIGTDDEAKLETQVVYLLS
jgi:hypothetical protein